MMSLLPAVSVTFRLQVETRAPGSADEEDNSDGEGGFDKENSPGEEASPDEKYLVSSPSPVGFHLFALLVIDHLSFYSPCPKARTNKSDEVSHQKGEEDQRPPTGPFVLSDPNPRKLIPTSVLPPPSLQWERPDNTDREEPSPPPPLVRCLSTHHASSRASDSTVPFTKAKAREPSKVPPS